MCGKCPPCQPTGGAAQTVSGFRLFRCGAPVFRQNGFNLRQGFAGYFLLPAAGPAFTVLPDAGAQGFIAPHVIAIVKDGVTGMDVFPSLHTALPLFITAFLWRDGRRLAALLLAPVSLGIVVSTVFLRYHYGVDVLAGMLLAAAMAWRYTQKTA